MPNYANNITQRVQQAAAAMLQARVTGGTLTEVTNIYEGFRQANHEFPCAVCQCRSAEALPGWDGNWSAELVVRVESNVADTDEDTHHSIAGAVFRWFFQAKEDVATELSAALTDFAVQVVIPRRQTCDLVAGDNGSTYFVSELTLSLEECCGSDVA